MAKANFRGGRLGGITGLLLALLLGSAGAVCARDAFVVLSGGVSPTENNYSHYLQARALVTYFDRNYPRDSVWVFFGAGNVEGQKPVFGDVYHQVKRDGLLVDTWQAGSLPHNRPARRDVILRAFRDEILPAVAGGGTIYLFVGDHGSRTRGRDAESVIDLWGMYRDADNEHGWSENADESLGVAELRSLLASGIGKGRMVFCMTQCHSGGFHYLAIPHEMTANPRWFTKTPNWLTRREPSAALAVAGFSATDEYSLASGCDPSPDPDQWLGYERFIPENLLGMNLFTLERTGNGLRSFAQAHAAAMLVDNTIDKPYSTSEQYLERWATLIETRLVREPNLTPRVKGFVAAYQRTVDGTAPKSSDVALRERQEQYRGFIGKMAQQNSAVNDLVTSGTRQQLEGAINPSRNSASAPAQVQRGRGSGRGQGRRGGGGGGFGERRRLWTETIRPVWKDAVQAGQSSVPAAALEFEKYLLGQEDDGRSFLFGGSGTLSEEVFWHSGYSDPQTVNAAKAEAISRWAADRRNQIQVWAKTSADETVRNAADRLAQLGPQRPPGTGAAGPSERSISRRTAAERTLFYRRVLGAWEFLIAVNERPALARLRELTELERTPLPKAR